MCTFELYVGLYYFVLSHLVCPVLSIFLVVLYFFYSVFVLVFVFCLSGE